MNLEKITEAIVKMQKEVSQVPCIINGKDVTCAILILLYANVPYYI